MTIVQTLVSKCYSDHDYMNLIAESCHRYVTGYMTKNELMQLQLAIQVQISKQ